MIIWLNGTFGVGKTTTSKALLSSREGLRFFDPEHVGFMLGASMHGIEYSDFQDLSVWRRLVPIVASEIVAMTGDELLAVQSVLREQYWAELTRHLDQLGQSVFHVVLDCAPDELRRRIEDDEVEAQAKAWRLDHMEAYASAKPWLIEAADLVVDTTDRVPAEVVSTIINELDTLG